jgi:CheY-like chemotaxis protein
MARVLLAEDDDAVRDMLRAALERCGFDVVAVDFSKVLLDVITIADEVDSQLKQAMLSFDEPQASGISLVAVNQ